MEKPESPRGAPFPAVTVALLCGTLIILAAIGAALYTLSAWHVTSTTTREAVSATVTDMNSKAKLVVLTLRSTVVVRETNTGEFLGRKVPGTTIDVLVVAQDNGIQYVVDLSQIKESDFRIDASNKKVTVSAPAPRLDEEMVSVQTDPTRIEILTTKGMFRWNDDAEGWQEYAKARIRPKLIEQGRADWIVRQARESAASNIKNLVSKIQKQGFDVEVEFKN